MTTLLFLNLGWVLILYVPITSCTYIIIFGCITYPVYCKLFILKDSIYFPTMLSAAWNAKCKPIGGLHSDYIYFN